MTMNEVRHFVHKPGGILRRYVREILWVRRASTGTGSTAGDHITLVLRQSGSASLPQIVAQGDSSSAVSPACNQRTRMVEHAAGSSVVIVRFTEVGAPGHTGERGDLLYNQTVPLERRPATARIDQSRTSLPIHARCANRSFSGTLSHQPDTIPQNGISPQIEAAARDDSQLRRSVFHCSDRASCRHEPERAGRHFRAAEGATPKRLSRLAVCSMSAAMGHRKNLTEIPLKPVTAINRIWCATSGSLPIRLPRNFFAARLLAICRTFYK